MGIGRVARDQIPITPSVLRWARERACYTLEEIGADFRDIDAWEQGRAFPTYPQLERLSERFKVPIAIFFFPEPPDVPPIRDSFRTLPDAQFATLPRQVQFLLRKAKTFQINLYELNDGRNPAEHFILNDLAFEPDMDIPKIANHVRHYFGVPLDVQTNWPSLEAAFDAWRTALEEHGVAVFKDAFRDDAYSGFCLYDDHFPLIFVNNSVKTRQIFTLFHELAHLLFHTSGVNPLSEEPHDDLPPRDRRIEVTCNRFAAEFLLPAARFDEETRNLPQTSTLLLSLPHGITYLVSSSLGVSWIEERSRRTNISKPQAVGTSNDERDREATTTGRRLPI